MTNDLPQTKLDPDLKTSTEKEFLFHPSGENMYCLHSGRSKSKECIDENLQLKEFYKYTIKGI